MTIAKRLIAWAKRRPPNVVIGGLERPYLLRWFFIPRNRFFNIYIHKFLRSDDDRALHDHPWANASFILANEYAEHRIEQGGVNTRTMHRAGDWNFRASGKIAHRVELTNGPCWTLFLTGPNYREWGFHCPEQGWIHWKRFTAEDDPGAIGKGCDA
jgi:hypothetical protein